jgi:hypothetical protein
MGAGHGQHLDRDALALGGGFEAVFERSGKGDGKGHGAFILP